MFKKKTYTGVAWLSSARAVRCLVKSFNERNSYFVLFISFYKKNFKLQKTANEKLEEGENDVKPLWPL